jgi:hypothetical protein
MSINSIGSSTGASGLNLSSSVDPDQFLQEMLTEILTEILDEVEQQLDSALAADNFGAGTPQGAGSGASSGLPSSTLPQGYGGGSPQVYGGGSGSGAPQNYGGAASRSVAATGGSANGAPAGGTSQTGAASGTSKGGPNSVDLSDFSDLQLPTGSAGNVDTVSASKLSNYNSPYFKHNGNGSITLTVPEGGGVHTAHSSYPRSELEEKGSWRMSSGTSTLSATTSVDKLPANGDVVIGQIHQKAVDGGKPRPPVELHYDKGNIVASVMDSNSPNAGRHNVTIATGVKPGQKFSYSMQVQPNGQLNISADGKSKTVTLDPSFKSSNMYFKAGNYCQDPSGGSAVTFYGLNISHTK